MVSEPVKDSKWAVPPRILCSKLVQPRKPKSCTNEHAYIANKCAKVVTIKKYIYY